MNLVAKPFFQWKLYTFLKELTRPHQCTNCGKTYTKLCDMNLHPNVFPNVNLHQRLFNKSHICNLIFFLKYPSGVIFSNYKCFGFPITDGSARWWSFYQFTIGDYIPSLKLKKDVTSLHIASEVYLLCLFNNFYGSFGIVTQTLAICSIDFGCQFEGIKMIQMSAIQMNTKFKFILF